MRTLVLEPVGGMAGDMTLAALLHLGAPRAVLDEGLRKLSLGAEISVSEVDVGALRALHVEVRAPRESHAHRPYREIRDLIARAALPARAADLAQKAFALLARAEGKLHGIAPEQDFSDRGGLKDHHDGRDQAGQECLDQDACKDHKAATEVSSISGLGEQQHVSQEFGNDQQSHGAKEDPGGEDWILSGPLRE